MLGDTYNLEILIETTEKNHFRFDMHGVFSIIKQNEGYAIVDLYKNHGNLTQREVAESNA